MGGYNRTFSAALRQAKFYLPQQPPAAALRQSRRPENTMPRYIRGDPPCGFRLSFFENVHDRVGRSKFLNFLKT